MKIRFLLHTNVRIDPNNLTRDPLGVVFANTELEVENRPYQGRPLKGNDVYYRDDNGWYYWSGGTMVIPEGSLLGTGSPAVQMPNEPMNGKEKAGPLPPVESTIPEASAPSPLRATSEAATTPSPPVRQIVMGERLTITQPEIIEIHPSTNFTLAWPSALDNCKEIFWQREQVFGQGVKVAIVSNHYLPTTGLVGERGVKINTFGVPLSTPSSSMHERISAAKIIGSRAADRAGVAPEAEVFLAKLPAATATQDPEQWMTALRWIKSIQPDVLLLDDFLTWQTPPISVNRLLADLAATGTLIFAPCGEGRGRLPKNYWPASESGCIVVGAYDQSGQPMASNQLSTTLDLLGPGRSGNTRQVASPSCAAAAYVAGIAALARQWANAHYLTPSPAEWKRYFVSATYQTDGHAAAAGRFASELLLAGLKKSVEY